MNRDILTGIDYGCLEFKCREDNVQTKPHIVKGEFKHLFCTSCGTRINADRARSMIRIELEYFRDKKLQDGMLGALVAACSQAINESMDELNRNEWEFILLENNYVIDFIHDWIYNRGA